MHLFGYFSDVIVDVKTVDEKVTPKCKMDDIFKPKMEQNLINNEDHWKSADMRLDRAGSIRLRVGPPQIAPKIQKSVLEIRRDFKAEFLPKKVSNMSKIGSKMGSVWMLLANFLRFFFEGSKKGTSDESGEHQPLGPWPPQG